MFHVALESVFNKNSMTSLLIIGFAAQHTSAIVSSPCFSTDITCCTFRDVHLSNQRSSLSCINYNSGGTLKYFWACCTLKHLVRCQISQIKTFIFNVYFCIYGKIFQESLTWCFHLCGTENNTTSCSIMCLLWEL